MSRPNKGKSSNYSILWTPPEFKQKVKVAAAKRGVTMQEFLRNLEVDGEVPVVKKKNVQRWIFEV